MEGSSGSWFVPRAEGFRVRGGRFFPPPEGELKKKKVITSTGSYPGRKGLGFGAEGSSGSWFLFRVEGFRAWGVDFRVLGLTPDGGD